MYQLDIITTCRNLKIPLEKVKEIISSRDNEKVVKLLMEYQMVDIPGYGDPCQYDGSGCHFRRGMLQ